MKAKVIAKVNNVHILITSDEEYVPISPICEALKVDINKELENIKRDSILSNSLKSIQLEDFGKTYCIPYMYALGWIYIIGKSDKKGENKECTPELKIQCMEALHNYLIESKNRLIEKMDQEINQCNEIIELYKELEEMHDQLETEMEKLFKVSNSVHSK